MKILCLHKDSGEHFRLTGFGNAFRAAGHEFMFWHPKNKPIFDVFDEWGPVDLFIGTTFDLDRATHRCLVQNPNTKILLKGSNWGPSNDKIDHKKYPIVMVNDNEKAKVRNLRREASQDIRVMCHYHPNRLEETMSGWREIGIEPLAVMNAADVIDYGPGTYREELASDVSFVGGTWGYKGQNIDKFILPLCHPVGKLNIKIWGNTKWPVPQCLGVVNTPDVKDIYASAVVCPNVSEPHSNEFGFDVVERVFKIISAGGICISDYVESLYEDVFTGDELFYYQDSKQIEDHVRIFKNEQTRKEYLEKTQFVVYDQHTYFHRVADICDAFDWDDEAKHIMQTYLKYNILLRVGV